MAIERRYSGKINQEEMGDVELRTRVFQQMALDLKRRAVRDVPKAISSMMEAAFRAGAEAVRQDRDFSAKDRLHRPMTEMDIPDASVQALDRIRFVICGGSAHGQIDFDPRPVSMIFAVFPSDYGRGIVWKQAGEPFHHVYEDGAIKPLIELGLIEVFSGLTRFSFLTQWGYELITTGATSLPGDRDSHASNALEWQSAVSGGVLRKAVDALGIGVAEDKPQEAATLR
jgi:hypothetical protein